MSWPDPHRSQDDLLPARAVNAHVFCPRLFWLEHVESYFEHNEHTLKGKQVHKRVDKPGGSMPPPAATATSEADADEPGWHTRSLWLSCEELGVTGKLDLVEATEGVVMPVDTKKGAPTKEGTLWPADRVQLALQGLLLRSAGYTVHEVAAWYHKTRRRVSEPLGPELEATARAAVAAARATAAASKPPAMMPRL